MKNLILLIIAISAFAYCTTRSKDFSTVSRGMTKEEVLNTVGEPQKTQDIEFFQLWTYTNADRTVIFRKDTVYRVVTSANARIDSIRMEADSLGADIKNAGKKAGEEMRELGDSIESKANMVKDKFKLKDTTKKN